MPRHFPIGLAVALATASLSAAAPAATAGLEVRVSGSLNTPSIRLRNIGETAQLTTFEIALGQPAYAFDYVQGIGAEEPFGGTTTILIGDTANDAVRTDRISLAFTGFDRYDWINFGTDLDLAGSPVSTSENVELVFGILGGGAPATVTADFSDGSSLSMSFDDAVQDFDSTWVLSGTATPVAPVPLPVPALLLSGALSALIPLRARSRRLPEGS